MDLKVTYIQDVLDTSKIDVEGNVILISGSDFSHTSHLIINGDISTNFTVVSNHKIVAPIPEKSRDELIRDVAVISSTFTATKRSSISFELGTNPQTTSGLLRLMQRFIMLLMRNPGSDILNPKSGGGMGRLARQFMQGAQTVTASDVALAVDRAKRQLLKLQASNPYLSDSERLANAELQGVEYSETLGSLSPRIKITSQSGQTGRSVMSVS